MHCSLGFCDSGKELKHQLLDTGCGLLTPPSSNDELLTLLDKVEHLLSMVEQDPSGSMRDALLPSSIALISKGLLGHPNMDIQISVVSCISELVRITAPCPPYDDEKMAEIFQLIVLAFEKLSLLSGHCYSKALRILETVAAVRACVMLLDLGCEALIVKIFKLFFNTITFDHPSSVFIDMKDIMTWVIDESDDISAELLKCLLASVKKENQNISPVSRILGMDVLKKCSVKVRPYLRDAMKSVRPDFDDYAEIVALLCQDEFSGQNLVVEQDSIHHVKTGPSAVKFGKSLLYDGTMQTRIGTDNVLQNGNSSKSLKGFNLIERLNFTSYKGVLQPKALGSGEALDVQAGAQAVPRKRGRKPNSLKKPEEGYEHGLTNRGKNSLEVPHKSKNIEKLARLPVNLSPKESPLLSETLKESKCSIVRKRGSSKKKESFPEGTLIFDQVVDKDSPDSDVALRKGSGNTENTEGKPWKGSRTKSATMIDREKTPSLSNKVIKKENDILCVTDENLLDRTVKIKCQSNQGLQGEEGSKRPCLVKEYGEELVGLRIKVWWPFDKTFYKGIVRSFNPSKKKKHEVLYDDGDLELLNLNKERWVPLDDESFEQGQETNLRSLAPTSVKSREKRANMKTMTKIEQKNPVSSVTRSQKGPQKTGSKPAEGSTFDMLCIKQLDNAKTDVAKDNKDILENEGLNVGDQSGI